MKVLLAIVLAGLAHVGQSKPAVLQSQQKIKNGAVVDSVVNKALPLQLQTELDFGKEKCGFCQKMFSNELDNHFKDYYTMLRPPKWELGNRLATLQKALNTFCHQLIDLDMMAYCKTTITKLQPDIFEGDVEQVLLKFPSAMCEKMTVCQKDVVIPSKDFSSIAIHIPENKQCHECLNMFDLEFSNHRNSYEITKALEKYHKEIGIDTNQRVHATLLKFCDQMIDENFINKCKAIVPHLEHDAFVGDNVLDTLPNTLCQKMETCKAPGMTCSSCIWAAKVPLRKVLAAAQASLRACDYIYYGPKKTYDMCVSTASMGIKKAEDSLRNYPSSYCLQYHLCSKEELNLD